MNEQNAYNYIVSVLKDETRMLTEAVAAGKLINNPVDRLRARLSKEYLIEALTDDRLDIDDARCIKETLQKLYNFELTSQ